MKGKWIQKDHLMKKLSWNNILLGIILIAQIILIVGAGIQKKGYFVDELWGYGLANSYYHPHIYSDYAFANDEYKSPDYFRDYLEVSEDEAFKYDSVFYNQSMDAHPPLFYCVLHTICSVFKNTFSKWYGIIPNIIYFTIASIGLYILSKELIQNQYIALFPVIYWGFSLQTVSYTILVRMYMLFTMFVVMNSLLHYIYFSHQEKWNIRWDVALVLINVGGFLTQYYYYIFAFFLSAFTALFILLKREWKQFLHYCGVMLSSVALAFFIFPGIVHTFIDNRGAEAVDNLVSDRSWLSLLEGFIKNINEKMLYGYSKWFTVLIIIAVCMAIIFGILKNFNTTVGEVVKSINWTAPALWVALLTYMIVIIKISPYIADRYYYAITPIFWLLMVHLIYKGFGKLKHGAEIGICLFSLCVVLSVIQGYKDGKIMYQFKNQGKNMEEIQKFKGSSCVYITNGREYTAVLHALEFQNFSEIKIINVSWKNLTEAEIHNDGPSIVVYVDDQLNQDETLSQIMQKTGYKECVSLGRGSGVGWEDMEEMYIYALR